MHAIRLMSLLIMLGLMTGCTILPRFYLGADEIHGKIIDADSKAPIEDVIVLEIWEQYNGLEGGHYNANLILKETLSDVNGYYKFSGWGPRLTFSGYLEDTGPILVFYKYGYDVSIPRHTCSEKYEFDGRSRENYKYSKCTGMTIELTKYSGSEKDYASKLPAKNILLEGDVWGSRICDWKRIPMFTAAMIKVNAIKITDLEYVKCNVNPGGIENIIGK